MPIEEGKPAPTFTLKNTDGNEVALQDLRGKNVIVYFYPKDDTPGCTKEACAFRDMHDDILSVGLRVIGISPQSAESHRRFREEHNLPFTLLCDEDKVAIKMYDVDGPFGVGVRRVTYLVSQRQKIQAALQADIMIDKHKEFVERAIVLRETAGLKAADSEG